MPTAAKKATREDFGVPNAAGFVPIPLDTLRVDSIPDFNLYNRVGRDYILYRTGAHPFTDRQRQALIDHMVKALYVPAAELALYWQYLERNISLILSDPLLPPEKKAEVFKTTAIGLTRDVLTSPASQAMLQKAGEVVKSSARLLLHGKRGLHAFIRMIGRDANLYAHSVNVCTYGIALARAAGVDAARLEEMGIGLLLHDLGMTETAEAAVNKPGPLTSAQWQAIRAHPDRGLKRYEECGGNSDVVRVVILCHHERCDGTGYPRGLARRQIPVPARIAAIANVFDALTTARPFRPALTTYAAIKSMKQEIGNSLDQEMLDIFIRLMGPE